MGASDFLVGQQYSNPYIKKFYSENFNDKLLEALDAYIIWGYKLYREKEWNVPAFTHHTMLIHTSTLKDDHEKDVKRVVDLKA